MTWTWRLATGDQRRTVESMDILNLAGSVAEGEPERGRMPPVYSAREMARATGVSVRTVRELIASADLETVEGQFISHQEAVRVGRALIAGLRPARVAAAGPPGATAVIAAGRVPILSPLAFARRPAGLSFLASVSLHGFVGLLVIVATAVGVTSSEIEEVLPEKAQPMRLVYLNLPGPGGGGGGGGTKQAIPPPRAERRGTSRLSSPIPARRVVPVEPPPAVEPPKAEVLPNEALPPIAAPVMPAPSDIRDRAGVLEEAERRHADSRGPGSGGGAGMGDGTGLGQGTGPGVGPGSGGGTGGGPYRPGSGIQPPRLLREVKPNYTEEARQRNIEGDVLLEIVVRRDGTVGAVRILESLGWGLDERAVQAVRQWRFAPASRLGAPVDVVVEVAVEFRLR